jgi:hypothetical protein
MKSHRIRIDFAPGARRFDWSSLMWLGVALLALTVAVVQLSQVMVGNANLAGQLSLLQARPSPDVSRASQSVLPSKVELVQTKALRQVTQKLTTPWSDLLQSLESAPNRAVALLSVEPSASRRSVRLTAEARTLPDMVAYLGALQHDARLTSVVLVSHQVQSQMPGAPVRFQIQAGWGGDR